MKLTTYLMGAAFLAGLAVTIGTSISVPRPAPQPVIGGEEHSFTIQGPVATLRFIDTPASPKVKIDNYKGIALTESDTATCATLHTAGGWDRFITTTITPDSTLTVTIDRQAIADLYGSGSSAVRVRSEEFVVARVIVPRGTVSHIQAPTHTIYLDSLVTPRLDADVQGRIVFNASAIDTLSLIGKSPREIKSDSLTTINTRLRPDREK